MAFTIGVNGTDRAVRMEKDCQLHGSDQQPVIR
jgi:hypothetical protein